MDGKATRGTGVLSAVIPTQALVEYGVLNTLARDATMALQRLGGWAARNWIIVAVILAGILVLSLRPRR